MSMLLVSYTHGFSHNLKAILHTLFVGFGFLDDGLLRHNVSVICCLNL